MPSVAVFRPSDISMDRNRLYKIVIDGVTVGELWPGQVGTFAVSAGSHNVEVKIDFMKSNELTVQVAATQIAELACRGHGSLWPCSTRCFDGLRTSISIS